MRSRPKSCLGLLLAGVALAVTTPTASSQDLIFTDAELKMQAFVRPDKPVSYSTLLTYARVTQDPKTIHTVDWSGSGDSHLTSVGYYVSPHPTWSPDGQKIVFMQAGVGIVVRTLSTGVEQVIVPMGGSYDGYPYWSYDGTKIAYEGPGDTIWTVNPDGSENAQVGTGNGRVPCLSPGGSKIAFADVSSPPDVWIMNADGSNPVNLTNSPAYDGGSHVGPVWSPDGQWIAYLSGPDASSLHVWKMRPDGTYKTQLTSGSPVADSLDWTRDGRFVVYMDSTQHSIRALAVGAGMIYGDPVVKFQAFVQPGSSVNPWTGDTKVAYNRNAGDPKEIWLVNGDGSGNSYLTTVGAFVSPHPTWSQDGQRLVFMRRDVGLVVQTLSSGAEQVIVPIGGSADGYPFWSYDGTRIVYEGPDDTVWTVNPDGSGNAQVGTGTGRVPCFSPDNSRIVFVRGYGTSAEVFIMNSDGSGEVNLTNSSLTYDGGDHVGPVWSPDGQWIAYLSGPDAMNFQVWRMKPDGTQKKQLTFGPAVSGSTLDWTRDGKYIVYGNGNGETTFLALALGGLDPFCTGSFTFGGQGIPSAGGAPFSLSWSGAPVAQPGVLLFGLTRTQPPIPAAWGQFLFVQPLPVSIPLGSGFGAGMIGPISVPAGLVGAHVYAQMFFADGSAYVASNGLDIWWL